MVKKIAIFNHKGGVSKTTTSFHLGWAIAKTGKKVILVDSDSQCNLTLFALGYDRYNEFYETNDPNNINFALRPAYHSEPRLIEAVDCISVPLNQNLMMLPGHLDFSENEVQLGVAMQLSEAFGTMKNLPGAFSYMLDKTAARYQADYMIIDMNPSLSAINQDILLSSDYFIVPTSPDFFSVMAVRSLARVIPTWEKWAANARDLLADATYPLQMNTPKFLGYTINDFNLSSGHAQQSFRAIMDSIASEIENTLIPAFKKSGMLLPLERYETEYEKMRQSSNQNHFNYRNPFCLAEISNFNKLIALSNEESIPVFELKLVHANPGQHRTLNWFRFLFEQFAQRIIRLTND